MHWTGIWRRRIFRPSKTLDRFQGYWPKKINRQQVQGLFRLAFVPARSNIIFLFGVGLGKAHLATALGYAAVIAGHTVRFAGAVDIINTLMAARADRCLKAELQKLVHPAVLIIDELGYLLIDMSGADLHFPVISQRCERGSTILTTNQPFKAWPRSSTTIRLGGAGPAPTPRRNRRH